VGVAFVRGLSRKQEVAIHGQQILKAEHWTRDGTKVDNLLYAGNNPDKAKDVFAQAIKHRPRISLFRFLETQNKLISLSNKLKYFFLR
jgi:hypothetical protein